MRGFRADNLRSKRTTAQAATGTIGSGANGVITVTVDTAGADGNNYTIAAVLGVGNDVSLSAAVVGKAITITLGTNGGGTIDATKNTATLVAVEVDGVAGVTAAASGTGATALAVTGAQTFSGGHDVWTVGDFAKVSRTSDQIIYALEGGGNCEVQTAQRIADTLSIALSALGSSL